MTHPDLPLFEDDLDSPGVVAPARVVPRGVDLPETVVLCWFHEVVGALGERGARVVTELQSENGGAPVWELEHRGVRVAVANPGVGAPMAAIVLEELVALGAQRVVACGGAGALLPDLVLGHAVVVESAVRDEGTSFQYLPPSRWVDADRDVVASVVRTLDDAGVAHVVGRTWTTDALFRETRARTARRVAEGCVTVEMEASALIAVARRLGVPYGHLLMAGDSLAGDEWEHRGWSRAGDARTALFDLTLEAAVDLTPVPLRSLLRAAIITAARARDREALALYRTTLAAIENAEAVTPVDHPAAGALQASPVGAGAAEVARRELTAEQDADIVRGEADERRAAADEVAPHDRARAEQLRREAALLDDLFRR